jgi:hypothetical protein
MSDEDLKQLIASNAKAIQALTADMADFKREWQKDREEWKKDRRAIYGLLSRLTRSMSDFYEIQSDFYQRFDRVDEREEKMIEVLRKLTGENTNSED